VTRVEPLTRRAYAPVAVRSGFEIEPVGQGLRPPAARPSKALRRPSPEGDGARRERGDCSSCSRGNAIDRIGEPPGMKSRASVRRVVGKSKAHPTAVPKRKHGDLFEEGGVGSSGVAGAAPPGRSLRGGLGTGWCRGLRGMGPRSAPLRRAGACSPALLGAPGGARSPSSARIPSGGTIRFGGPGSTGRIAVLAGYSS